MTKPEPPPPSLTFRGEDWSLRAWLALLRDLYLTFDRRTLGLTRILLGFLLVMDLIHRRAAWDQMYSTIGVLPAHVSLARPQAVGAFSIFHAFSTPAELAVVWWIMLAVAACLLVGYRTKIAQILALLFVTGMNGRVLLIENGGYVVENLLLLWTAFLPLGDRFSIDAMIASMRSRREASAADLDDRREDPREAEPHVSAVGLAILLQLSAIYFFNVVHKTGNAWRNGTAVHYVLHVDRMATPIVAVVRDHLPVFAILFMTKAALTFEAALPVALCSPVGRAWARRVAIFMINTLHIAFGTTFVLGPFAWSLCVFSTLLFGREDWELAIATMRRPRRARVVVFDPRSGGALLACRIVKRLDRFALLTFVEGEGAPLGVGVRRPEEPQRLVVRTEAWMDIVAALPLGPLVAWVGRLPIIQRLLDLAFEALSRRDLSRFFGLRAPSSPHASEPLAPPREAAHVPAIVVMAGLLAVSGAAWVGWSVGRPAFGMGILVAVIAAAVTASAFAVLPVVTTRALGRAIGVALREALVVAMIAAALNQGAIELWAINRRYKIAHVEPLRTLTQKLRFLQGWFMFSPNPAMEDGTIVVDAITVDGRHVDPFTGKTPDFDLSAAKSLRLTQIWCDYYNRMQLSANVGYREAMKDYMLRLPSRTGNQADAIVSGDVYWVKDLNPRWNESTPWGYERNKLFSFTAAPPIAE